MAKKIMSILTTIRQHCQVALAQAFPLQDALAQNFLEITEATQKKFGDYQCNSAMKLSKIFKLPPLAIATAITQQILQNDGNNSLKIFQQVEVVNPGFINFTLNPQYIQQCINQQLQDKRQGVTLVANPEKVVIDFSSPNIAKEMHVGHLRTTIIGDCIARVLEFIGHDVLRLNHVGDWGTQFGMLIAYIKEQYQQPEHIKLNLTELATCYRQSKEKFDADPIFKQTAQQEVVALQSGDPYAHSIWQQICKISAVAYQEIYDLLDIKIIERGESFYNPFLADIIKTLAQKNLLRISNGAKCVDVAGMYNREGEPLPLIVQKSDGGYNYATTDLAALQHRANVEHGTWLIYVIDAGQSQHLQMVFNVARQAELCQPAVKLDHVAFGLVLRADGKKFKTRSGDTEKLMDLLTTAIDKAKVLLHSRNPELTETELDALAKTLGLNAIKYADLSTNRTHDYAFSYEKMLQFEGNTAAFLAYACVRIQSIKRKLSIDMAHLMQDHTIMLQEPAEVELALHACKFADCITTLTKELLPNRLTDYLFNLAEKFHAFFHQCKVVGSPHEASRLLLCEATLQVLYRGFGLLGLTMLDKM